MRDGSAKIATTGMHMNSVGTPNIGLQTTEAGGILNTRGRRRALGHP